MTLTQVQIGAEPAPFIGDDIFQTFDDDRTAAGLAARQLTCGRGQQREGCGRRGNPLDIPSFPVYVRVPRQLHLGAAVRVHEKQFALQFALGFEDDPAAVGRPASPAAEGVGIGQVVGVCPVAVHDPDLGRRIAVGFVEDGAAVGRPSGRGFRAFAIGQVHDIPNSRGSGIDLRVTAGAGAKDQPGAIG